MHGPCLNVLSTNDGHGFIPNCTCIYSQLEAWWFQELRSGPGAALIKAQEIKLDDSPILFVELVYLCVNNMYTKIGCKIPATTLPYMVSKYDFLF